MKFGLIRSGCRLKEEREKCGLSLNVLAQKSGLSRQTVICVERQLQNPTLDTLLRITSVLEIELEKNYCQSTQSRHQGDGAHGVTRSTILQRSKNIFIPPVAFLARGFMV